MACFQIQQPNHLHQLKLLPEKLKLPSLSQPQNLKKVFYKFYSFSLLSSESSLPTSALSSSIAGSSLIGSSITISESSIKPLSPSSIISSITSFTKSSAPLSPSADCDSDSGIA